MILIIMGQGWMGECYPQQNLVFEGVANSLLETYGRGL